LRRSLTILSVALAGLALSYLLYWVAALVILTYHVSQVP
jgi:hypothetical protein